LILPTTSKATLPGCRESEGCRAGKFWDYRNIPRDVFKAALERMRPKRKKQPD
jgi:hypothetical protein